MHDEVAQERKPASSPWQMTTVWYKYNRGVVFYGDLRHLATKIERLDSSKRRVILGFNCFSSQTSECNLRAHEHSNAFNRTIKLYQTIGNVNRPAEGTDEPRRADKAKLTATEDMKNPALARLIVAAAKKVKALQNPQLLYNIACIDLVINNH